MEVRYHFNSVREAIKKNSHVSGIPSKAWKGSSQLGNGSTCENFHGGGRLTKSLSGWGWVSLRGCRGLGSGYGKLNTILMDKDKVGFLLGKIPFIYTIQVKGGIR